VTVTQLLRLRKLLSFLVDVSAWQASHSTQPLQIKPAPAFTRTPNPDGDTDFFWYNLIERSLWLLQFMVENWILIHRLYHVFEQSVKLSLLPLALNVLFTVVGFTAMILGTVGMGTGNQHLVTIGNRLTWVPTISLLISQIYCTGLICFRLWSLRGRNSPRPWVKNVFRLLVESLAIYLVFGIVVVVVGNLPFPQQDISYILIWPSGPAAGILFFVMINSIQSHSSEDSRPAIETAVLPDLQFATQRRSRGSSETEV
jgi:hypothetical protein